YPLVYGTRTATLLARRCQPNPFCPADFKRITPHLHRLEVVQLILLARAASIQALSSGNQTKRFVREKLQVSPGHVLSSVPGESCLPWCNLPTHYSAILAH